MRPKLAVCAKSTVDMLAHTGAKYAYAQSKGRWVNMGDSRVYIEGDLDKSRKKVRLSMIAYQVEQIYISRMLLINNESIKIDFIFFRFYGYHVEKLFKKFLLFSQNCTICMLVN